MRSGHGSRDVKGSKVEVNELRAPFNNQMTEVNAFKFHSFAIYLFINDEHLSVCGICMNSPIFMSLVDVENEAIARACHVLNFTDTASRHCLKPKWPLNSLSTFL